MNMVICALVTDVPAGLPIPKGVERGVCYECLEEILLSPSSVLLVLQGAVPFCATCGLKKEFDAVAITKEGQNEFQEYEKLKDAQNN